MIFQTNISLKPYNTFGIDATAERFTQVNSVDQLTQAITIAKDPLILGGGSNILITKNLDQSVIHLNLKGKTILKRGDTHVLVEAQAGENWHEFVLWCLNHNFGGIENLSLIPGNVGTSPMQNIGAYGVEIKDVFYQLKALEIKTQTIKTFNKEDCEFGYRESVFKRALKNKYIILSVTFKLTTQGHILKTSYGAIREELSKKNIQYPTIEDISKAVITIRQSKLPDPNLLGNSGSFFKNPVVDLSFYNRLLKQYPSMPSYAVSDEQIKIPAGWLIEQCGFKGKRFGDAGVHQKQALVLVNYGNATGLEIYQLAQNIVQTVKNKFGISLEMEVNIL